MQRKEYDGIPIVEKRMEKVRWCDGRRGRRTKKCLVWWVKREIFWEKIRKRQSRWQDQMIASEGMLKAVIKGRMLGKAGKGTEEKRVPGWNEVRKDVQRDEERNRVARSGSVFVKSLWDSLVSSCKPNW
jgi:hypothetical protein